MRDEEQSFFAGVLPAADKANDSAGEDRPSQRMRGVAGQLRPYRDVRAGFESWRRVAMQVWTAREEANTVH